MLSTRKKLKVAPELIDLDIKQDMSKTFMIVTCCICLIGFMFVISKSISEHMDKRTESVNKMQELQQQVNSKQKENDKLRQVLKNNGILNGEKLITPNEFISFVGSVTSGNNLQLNRLTGGDVSSKDTVRTMSFDIEVEGRTSDLAVFVTALDTLPSLYTVKSVGYRQVGKPYWIDSDLNIESVVNWWKNPNKQQQTQTKPVEQEILTSDKVLDTTRMCMYLKIEFVSV